MLRRFRITREGLQNRHMLQMLRDAVSGFDRPSSAKDALFVLLMGLCTPKEAEHYSNLMGRHAHEMARRK